MESRTKSIPVDDLSLSVANLSLRNTRPEVQETLLNNSNPSAIPLYPQSIRASIPWNKNQICIGSNEGIPATGFSGDQLRKARGDYSFLNLAVTPEGSRNLQEIIMAGDSWLTSRVLESITSKIDGTPVIYYLMTDPFGCHMCSKVIDACNEVQLGFLVENIVKEEEIFIGVSTNSHGSKLMKKLIKLIKESSYSSLIVLRMSISFSRLMTNQIGSYVVNSCLDWLDVNQNKPLYEAGISQCLALATHVVGCVSLNYMIDKIQGHCRQQLLKLVAKNAVFLSQDPSGNHVVQKVLQLENPIFTALIGSVLRGHYVKLSTQKWGSHIVEKCLKSEAGSEYVVVDFVQCSSNQLLQIAKDHFGNYVIQTALKVTKQRNESLYRRLIESLQTNLGMLRFGFGKNIYNMVINESCYSIVVS
ncbi:pumilio 21 [Euphorbia peplus]|nr:pumilio 21 [Euphorbia peplus]